MHMPEKKSLQTEHHPPWGKKNTTRDNQPSPGVSVGPGGASVSASYAPGKQSAFEGSEVLTLVLGFGNVWFKAMAFSECQMGISLQVLQVL